MDGRDACVTLAARSLTYLTTIESDNGSQEVIADVAESQNAAGIPSPRSPQVALGSTSVDAHPVPRGEHRASPIHLQAQSGHARSPRKSLIKQHRIESARSNEHDSSADADDERSETSGDDTDMTSWDECDPVDPEDSISIKSEDESIGFAAVSRSLPLFDGNDLSEVDADNVSTRSESVSPDTPAAGTDTEVYHGCEGYHRSTSPLRAGEIQDQITGQKRKRLLMDDCARSRDMMYSRKWENLRQQAPEERGHVCGYEEGDSDHDFEQWQERKSKRVCLPGRIRDQISGTVRPRITMDDFPRKLQQQRYSERWDRLRDDLVHGELAREKIWGYRKGDLALTWYQLQQSREHRVGYLALKANSG